MQTLSKFNFKALQIASSGIVLVLLLGVACGAAAPAADKPAAPAATTQAGGAPIPTKAPIAAVTVAPTPATSAGAAVNPGKLTWMIAGWGNERFDYAFGVGGGNNYARILHGWLITTNERAELLPGIAAEWGVSADGLTWTVTVRKGATFHDGTEITAEDVLWTWRHQWNPEAVGWATQSGAQSVARIMNKIDQTGPDKVSMTTKFPDAGLMVNVSETSGAWWAVLPKRDKLHDESQEAAYEKNPTAAGPMKLVRHIPAAAMSFERFEDYYYQPKGGLPEDRRVKFKALDLRLVPEEATRVAALRAGEADIAPVSLATRKQVEAGGGRVVFGPEGVYMYIRVIGCYKSQFPCHDKRVRQALTYAFDKDLLRDRLFGGPEVFQVKGWTVVTPSSLGYSPELDPFPYNPAKARQLLADAGYPGGKGFGKLTVNTWLSTAIPSLPEAAQLIADFWKRELGLDVEVKVGDEAALKKAFLTDALHGQILIRDNEAQRDGSNSIRSSYGTPDHAGRMHEDPELLKLTQDTLGVFDQTKRDAAFNKEYRRVHDENYDIGVGYINIPWAVGPRVLTWQPWPFSFYPSNLYGITLK